MLASGRRYDIDWLRVIAIGLLLVYHIAIGFQSWGMMIGFITTDQPWESLWIPMSMLNIWRIPLLFFVSGMGVYFAMNKRSWKQLIGERTGRILVPFLFGVFAIVPLHLFLFQEYYGFPVSYTYGTGHLWFLGNIFIYVVVLSPLFYYVRNHQEGRVVKGICRVLSHPLGLLVVILVFTTEALLLKPIPYEMYAMTWHGFALGFIAFFFGFFFVLSGKPFWDMLIRWRWVYLGLAVLLFVVRLMVLQLRAPYYLLVAESDLWIFTVFAFGNKYLNHPGRVLRYLSQAAYPVYILHMIFLYLGSSLIFPLDIPVEIQFVLVFVFTLSGCLISFEIIKRIPYVRMLVGMKN